MKTWMTSTAVRVHISATELGASMAEHLLIVALIGTAVMSAVTFSGGRLQSSYDADGGRYSSAGLP
jgi:hypothetical protein